ncbi:MAG: amino acid transporter [Acidobacteria bacterium]|nr:amino acid transporter [Acidobacteriota bacterium]MCI0620952.1 amino acid transporter [Acidobacteriota bacterium]
MCLTGVDYFSTLGYQPGIAFLAAGLLSPFATLVLVLVTLLVALPIYRQVAARSPHGQGSIVMLEELLPRWRGKVFVLCLLGFALTDFVITITLSAADATAHIVENPFVPEVFHHPVGVTMALLGLLGAVFLKGFREAIWIAVLFVGVYLGLNAVLLTVGFYQVFTHPGALANWKATLLVSYSSPWTILGLSLILFPKLALGLSGFETGVAVMPHVRGAPGDTPQHPIGRIRNTQKLLLTAALIMSFALMASSIVTTLLIPAEAFAKGGEANGRALAFLAHKHLGHGFGTLYDIATICILWFAGASAMAGLLNLVPRYLPPYGMAPDWALARRPLVLVFVAITFTVTILFEANVDAQGGAYATGVLFLMSSAAVAVTIATWHSRQRWLYLPMAMVFVYTTILNIIERPEGIKIASFFIAAIVLTSLLSRVIRSTELRIQGVALTQSAQAMIDEIKEKGQAVRIIAHRPDKRTAEEYEKKEMQAREDHSLDMGEPVIFMEVSQGDASDFSDEILVRGVRVGRHNVLRCKSPAIPNAIAALLLHLRDTTGTLPHAYFGWTEGNPIAYVLKYLALGEGDTAPVTREVLRKAVENPLERPRIHVG